MSDMAGTAGHGTPLPAHDPANMMSLYMTRYDYDYNREGGQSGSSKGSSGGTFDSGVSGDVLNRPIFVNGTLKDDRDARTTYQVDYTAKDRSVKDIQRLVASVKGGVAAVAEAEGDHGTAYQREWYRPGLTASRADEDGTLPQTAYQDDYSGKQLLPSSAPVLPSNMPQPLYAGAPAAAYNADLLKPHDALEDDGTDIAPKITSRESLLPRSQRGMKARGWTSTFGSNSDNTIMPTTVTRSAGPSSTLGPAAALPGVYSCTSWDIGDVSRAHLSQLPVSLAHSIAANGIDVTANSDKAALLRQLARRDKKGGSSTLRACVPSSLRDEYDCTNPQLLSAQAQKTCAVSRRLEEEHHVHMSMYKSDYIDQSQLPELPGNPAGSADVRDTQTGYHAAAGEMTTGQLTKTMREMGQLRNAHGTLKPAGAEGEKAALSSMRATENAIAIDKADPHRHKLRF